MDILIACEESQTVLKEFLKRGHNAYSCDIENCSGGIPERHIKRDVIPLLNGKCNFETCDGVTHTLYKNWDMIIAFPPCTHLAVSGARHFEKKRENGQQLKAIQFFLQFMNCDCKKIAIENPVGIMSGTDYMKKYYPQYYLMTCEPSQYIQPYMFGDKARKKTGLWLHGLPLLKPTNIVEPELEYYTKKDGSITSFSKGFSSGFSSKERSKIRSKTFPGIAKAMAEQWG